MNDNERAYKLVKAYREILLERGVKKPWTEVAPTAADLDLARQRAGF